MGIDKPRESPVVNEAQTNNRYQSNEHAQSITKDSTRGYSQSPIYFKKNEAKKNSQQEDSDDQPLFSPAPKQENNGAGRINYSDNTISAISDAIAAEEAGNASYKKKPNMTLREFV